MSLRSKIENIVNECKGYNIEYINEMSSKISEQIDTISKGELALYYSLNGDYEKAIAIMSNIIDEESPSPQNWENFLRIGHIYLRMSNSKKAIDYFTKYCEIEKKFAQSNNDYYQSVIEFLYGIGKAYMLDEEYDLAIKNLVEGIKYLDLTFTLESMMKFYCLINIAVCNLYKNQKMKAVENIEEAFHILCTDSELTNFSVYSSSDDEFYSYLEDMLECMNIFESFDIDIENFYSKALVECSNIDKINDDVSKNMYNQNSCKDINYKNLDNNTQNQDRNMVETQIYTNPMKTRKIDI